MSSKPKAELEQALNSYLSNQTLGKLFSPFGSPAVSPTACCIDQKTVTHSAQQLKREEQREGQRAGGGDPHLGSLQPPRCPPGSIRLRLTREVATALLS